MKIADNIDESIEMIAQNQEFGMALEDCHPSILDVKEYDIDTHVRMQPAGIAYFGSLKKESERAFTRKKRNYELWQIEKKDVARGRLKSLGIKATIADVESRFIIDNRGIINQWEDELQELQRQRDQIGIWYDAWAQKSHSLREYIKLNEDDMYNTNDSTTTDYQLAPRANNQEPTSWKRPEGKSRGGRTKNFKKKMRESK